MREPGAVVRTAGTAVLVLLVAAALAMAFSSRAGAAETTNAVWGQGTRAPLPAGAQGGSLSAVSCPAAGVCTAVGTFMGGSGDQQALLLSRSDGSWQPQAATLPADADVDPKATLEAVSCGSPGNCTAVGTYVDAAGDLQGLIVAENAGSWSDAVTAPLPGDAQPTNNRLSLDSVSCPTATTCVAVGDYLNEAGSQVGLIETEIWAGFTEQAVVASMREEEAGGEDLESVACAGAGDCTAVGSYLDPSSVGQAMVVEQRSGSWQPAVPAPLPGIGLASNPEHRSGLDSVACLSSGQCTAAGDYEPSSVAGSGQPLVVTEGADGSLQAAGVPPGSAATTSGGASAVSCAEVGNCAAVGTAGQTRTTSCCERVGTGLLLAQSGGSWTQTAAMMPADAASPTATNDTDYPLPVLSSISCAAGGCSGAGTYEPAGEIQGFSYANTPLLINRSGTAWGSGFAPRLPADAATQPLSTPSGPQGPTDVIDAVSCATAGTCAAVGSYTNTAGLAEPLLLTSAPGSAPSSLAIQAPSTAPAGSLIPGSVVAATVSSQAGPTGTISFRVFGPSNAPPANCSNGGTQIGTATVSGVGSYDPSAGFVTASAGDYWWYATYSGDTNTLASASTCGPGMTETVAAAHPVPPPRIICPKPTGRLTARAVGPIALGITRRTAQRRLTHHTGTATSERFCLTGGAATHVLYASQRLLARLPAKSRHKLTGKVVLILTSSGHYTLGKGQDRHPAEDRAARAEAPSRPPGGQDDVVSQSSPQRRARDQGPTRQSYRDRGRQPHRAGQGGLAHAPARLLTRRCARQPVRPDASAA